MSRINGVREYRIWISMKDRCYREKHKFFHLYGGRGIRVCERWVHSFANFAFDMGSPPSWDHSLDRIDADGDYSPENCRWATHSQQNCNRRGYNRVLTHAGRSQTVAEWSRETGLNDSTIRERLRRGWCGNRVLSTERAMRGIEKARKERGL